jgi:CheY-like chemotaxis protein
MNTRVLVVEDEALLALDIAKQLTDAGLDVIGPAVSVAKALSRLRAICAHAAPRLSFSLVIRASSTHPDFTVHPYCRNRPDLVILLPRYSGASGMSDRFPLA